MTMTILSVAVALSALFLAVLRTHHQMRLEEDPEHRFSRTRWRTWWVSTVLVVGAFGIAAAVEWLVSG